MPEKLSSQKLIELLEKVSLDMEASQDKLRELDAAAGDGDLGISVKLGFKAIRDNLSQVTDEDIGAILVKSGMAFNRAGASTFGTLIATAFMRAGGEVKGLKEIGIEHMAIMMRAAVQGIKERGKASQGERTMLDALIPVQETLEEYVESNRPLNEIVKAAAEAAEKGARSTAGMKARHGRARWTPEKSMNVPDAGATAIAMMLNLIVRYLGKECRGN